MSNMHKSILNTLSICLKQGVAKYQNQLLANIKLTTFCQLDVSNLL